MTIVETVPTLDKTTPFHILRSKRTPVIGDVLMFQTADEELSFEITHVQTGKPLMKGYHCLGWVSRVEIDK